jgi:hypothetical protein
MTEERQPFRLRWTHYLLAVLVYGVLLLAWAPASLLAWALPRFTQQTLWLEQAQGGVWRGEAAGVRVQAAAGDPLQLGSASWRFRPVDLFSGRLGFQLQLGGTGIDARGVLRAGPGGVELREFGGELPAKWLEQLSPDLALWQPGGRLVLAAENVFFGREEIEGEATLRWLDAVSGRVRQPLGSYRATIDGAGKGIKFRLGTESGALFLQGQGSWDPQRGVVFNGTARPAAASRLELEGLLSLIGPPQPNGDRVIRFGKP